MGTYVAASELLLKMESSGRLWRNTVSSRPFETQDSLQSMWVNSQNWVVRSHCSQTLKWFKILLTGRSEPMASKSSSKPTWVTQRNSAALSCHPSLRIKDGQVRLRLWSICAARLGTGEALPQSKTISLMWDAIKASSSEWLMPSLWPLNSNEF